MATNVSYGTFQNIQHSSQRNFYGLKYIYLQKYTVKERSGSKHNNKGK
jgi:hypothetical protein